MSGLDEEIVFHHVKSLLSKHSGVSPENIILETTLGENLCLVGDDAEEFFEEFGLADLCHGQHTGKSGFNTNIALAG